jgi:hypothetical protein
MNDAPTIDSQTPASAVFGHPDARKLIADVAPDALESPILRSLPLDAFPFGGLLRFILGEEDPRVDQIFAGVSQFDDRSAQPPHDAPIVPSADYEPGTVERGSARVDVPGPRHERQRVEVVLSGPAHGNPFTDVELSTVFTLGERRITVGGFYDGEGVYRVRFLPPVPGTWSFITSSNARSLDTVTGSLEVLRSDAPGPVHVEGRGFARADGSVFVPIGTTAYAWTHQGDDLQEETLKSLAAAPFNKLRMCVFPKSYDYNSNEPERFAFLRSADGASFDATRFDVEYFRRLERRIDQLADVGIEADLILFHPYDRWGFAAMGAAADDRYASYVVRRLAAFPNVWWSLANEYDLLTSKRHADWDRIAETVRANDPVGHPLSIHNWIEIFDYSAPWATHASIQGGGREMARSVDRWRRRWPDKPLLVDEFGYEGDLDQGWGNLTAEEVVRRFWEGTMRGAYLTHGETFHRDDERIFWAKGGTLTGESPARLKFLAQIIAESPTGRIDPLAGDWDALSGGAAGRYVLTYFGDARPRFRGLRVPEGLSARIEIIDTWAMTVEELPGVHEGDVRLELPARPYMAVRIREAS